MELLRIWGKVGKANIYIFALFQLKPVSQGNLTFDLCLASDPNSEANDFSSQIFGKGYVKC